MEILGYALAILVGLTLGLLGGGGSILCVPILFYLFDIEMEKATAYSLFVVGVSSIAGTFKYLEEKLVNLTALLVFGLPALISVWVNRKYIIKQIPDNLIETSSFTLDKDTAIMFIFAIMMLLAARIMIKGREMTEDDEVKGNNINYPLVILAGLIVGFLTSLVGAGGGFVIIPIMVSLFKMPTKRAIGTSLSIIMINSLFGFWGDVSAGTEIDWPFLMQFAGLAVVGIFIGIWLSHSIPGDKLKPFFGYFVLVIGAFILAERIIAPLLN